MSGSITVRTRFTPNALDAAGSLSFQVSIMPGNPYKSEQEARRNINHLLTKALASAGSMLYAEVVRETLIMFPVSETMVKHFIKEYYLDTEEVTLKDGVLFPGERNNKGKKQ